MRTIDSAAQAVLDARGRLPLAMLVNLDLDTPLLLNTSRWNLVWDGDTYLGAGPLGRVETTQESTQGPQPLTLTLNGLSASIRAQVLSENVQGKAVSLLVAIFDPATYQILDAVAEWDGTLDVMTWRDDGATAVVTVTAESSGADLLRGVSVRYTHQDQQRLYSGDLGFEFVVAQGEKTIVWPAATYFRR